MIRSQFKLSKLPVGECSNRTVVQNASVANAQAAFEAVKTVGDPLAARDGNLFPTFAYTATEVRGANTPDNCFRGVQRLRTGPYVVVSGGFSSGRRRSHVFMVRLGSRSPSGPWGSNVLTQASPLNADTIVGCYGLDTFRWRAGGISRLGDIVVVPIEGRRKSRVVFLDAGKPPALRRLKVEIDRPSVPSAEAAAIERLSDGRFLVGVWREVRGNYPGRLDMYLSHDDQLNNGFRTGRMSWSFDGFDGESDRNPRYRNISFITERRAAGQTQLYMIGTENGSPAAPLENGPDFADLWRVHLPSSVIAGGPKGKPRLEFVSSREFHALREQANFDAGAGIHVDDAGSLHLYACYHWRVEHTLRMTEYASHQPGIIQDVEDAWVELFEHDEFRGKRLSIYGTRHAQIADYSRIFVESGDFDDTVSSARFQIPKGYSYRLFRDANFKEKKKWGRASVDLVGTGTVVSVADLKDRPHRFGDKVSSSKFVKSRRKSS